MNTRSEVNVTRNKIVAEIPSWSLDRRQIIAIAVKNNQPSRAVSTPAPATSTDSRLPNQVQPSDELTLLMPAKCATSGKWQKLTLTVVFFVSTLNAVAVC